MAMFTAIIEKEDEMYIATCVEIGTCSQGHTIKEALANLKEATELYLEEAEANKIPQKIVKTFEVEINA